MTGRAYPHRVLLKRRIKDPCQTYSSFFSSWDFSSAQGTQVFLSNTQIKKQEDPEIRKEIEKSSCVGGMMFTTDTNLRVLRV